MTDYAAARIAGEILGRLGDSLSRVGGVSLTMPERCVFQFVWRGEYRGKTWQWAYFMGDIELTELRSVEEWAHYLIEDCRNAMLRHIGEDIFTARQINAR